MQLKDLLIGVEITKWNASPELMISGVSYDSRQTKPGDLFVAVRGFETDGHRFIEAALHGVAVHRAAPEIGAGEAGVSEPRLGRHFYKDPLSDYHVL